MISVRRSALLLVLIVGFCLTGSALENVSSFQDAVTETETPGSTPDEVLHPAPKDIKERIGIYVFLAWLWLSLLVMVYFLRLKVKELDRLHALKFFKDNGRSE